MHKHKKGQSNQVQHSTAVPVVLPVPPDPVSIDYKEVVPRLFVDSESYRTFVIQTELRKYLFGWLSLFGIGSIVAVVGILAGVQKTIADTVSTEVTKNVGSTVKTYVDQHTSFLRESFSSLSGSTVEQVVKMQKELETTRKALTDSEAQVNAANQKLADAQAKLNQANAILDVIRKNNAWINDSKNAERAATFIAILASKKDFPTIADLLSKQSEMQLDLLQVKLQMQFREAERSNKDNVFLPSPESPGGVVPAHSALGRMLEQLRKEQQKLQQDVERRGGK
jgi:hypothetical protein